MGVFTNMVKPDKTRRLYMVEVNGRGESIVREIVADGQQCDFAVNSTPRDLIFCLASALGYTVEMRVVDLSDDNKLVYTVTGGLAWTWTGLAKYLNSPKGSVWRTKVRAVMKAVNQWWWNGRAWVASWTADFIKANRSGKWAITAAAVAWDNKHYPELLRSWQAEEEAAKAAAAKAAQDVKAAENAATPPEANGDGHVAG